MSAITKEKNLRRVETNQKKKEPKEINPLIAQIKQGVKLKKTEQKKREEKKPDHSLQSIMANIRASQTGKKINNPASSIISSAGITPTGDTSKKIGTKDEVWQGKAEFWDKAMTKTVRDLALNHQGKVVNKKASLGAKTRYDRTTTALGPEFSTPMK